MWLLMYLVRPLPTEFLQPREPQDHIMEGLVHGILMTSPSWDSTRVTVREHHSSAYARDLLNAESSEFGLGEAYSNFEGT